MLLGYHRTSQPRGACGINKSHPLARFLVAALDPSSNTDLVTGKQLIAVGTTPSETGLFGKGLKANNSSLKYVTIPQQLGAEMSVIVVCNRLTKTAATNVLCGLGYSGSTASMLLQATSSNALRWALAQTINTSASARHYSTYASTSGDPAVIGCTWVDSTADNARTYFNGESDGIPVSNSSTGSNSIFNRFAVGGVVRSGNLFADSGNNTTLALLFNCALTPEQHRSISDNPWQLLNKPKLLGYDPIYVEAGAAVNDLASKNITLSAVTVTSPAIQQTHALTAVGISTAQIAVSTPSLSQSHVLSGNNIATLAVEIASPAVGQIHSLVPKNVSLGAVTVESPVITQAHSLTEKAIDLSSVTLSSPAISQIHVITPRDIVLGEVTVSKPDLSSASNTDNLSAKDIVLEALSITKPVIEQVHILTGLDIVTAGFDLAKADVGQVHVLTPEPVSLFEFTVTKPVLLSSESTDNLSAKDISLESVSITQAAINQVHVLSGKDISIGAVTASTPVVSQIHSLLSKSITLSALSISNPTLSSATVTAVYPLPEQVLLGVTYGPTGVEYTGTLVVGTGATIYIEQILSEVVDDQMIVLLQDEVIQSNILSETT